MPRGTYGLEAINTKIEALQHPPETASEIARLRAALNELYGYVGSVWFDEAVATDEERELMARTRIALRLAST